MSASRTALALLSGLLVMHSAAGSAAPVKTADQRLRDLYEAEWEWRGEQFARPSDEEERPADHFPKVDAASQEARIAYWRKALASLDAIPAAQLSPEEKINAAVFRTSLEAFIAEGRFRTWEMPLNSHSQFWSGLETRSPLRDAAAYRRYLDKLRDLPRYFDEQTVNMRAGLKRGFSVSRVTLEGRDKSIEAFTDADAEKSPFRPFFSALPTEPPFSASYVQFRSGHSFIEEPDPANHCDGTLLPVAVISGSVWLRRNRSFVTLRKSSSLCPGPQTIRTIHYEALLRDELRLAF